MEDKENKKGKGPDWIYDLDLKLTPSMNYEPVREENQVVHNEDVQEESQFIIHEVNIIPEAIPNKEHIVEEKEQSTVHPTTQVSVEDQTIHEQ